MTTKKKIKIYEEVHLLKKHFQLELLTELKEKVEKRILFDAENQVLSVDFIKGKKLGFEETKKDVLYLIDEAAKKVVNK